MIFLTTDIEGEYIVEIEKNGVFVNTKFLSKLSLSVKKKLKQLEEKIYSLSDCNFNIDDVIVQPYRGKP